MSSLFSRTFFTVGGLRWPSRCSSRARWPRTTRRWNLRRTTWSSRTSGSATPVSSPAPATSQRNRAGRPAFGERSPFKLLSRYGYSYDYPSAEGANAAALEHCNSGLKGKRDCQVRSTFSRNCIALATSDDGAWGYSATYGDLVADDQDALSRCQNGGGKSCTTVLAYCSPNAGFHTWVGLAISNEARPKAGISWGAPAQSTASKLAFDSCVKDGGSQCKVRMLLHNQCVAFATSPNGMWGAYNNVNRKLAESNAIRKCQESNGTNCAVVLSKCSTDP